MLTTACTAADPPADAPTATKKGRRASLVIAETAGLLGGLAEDHARSQNLMAELEALLASSSANKTANFAPVAPMEAPAVEVDEFQDDEEVCSAPLSGRSLLVPVLRAKG